jgi:hypothetical protein
MKIDWYPTYGGSSVQSEPGWECPIGKFNFINTPDLHDIQILIRKMVCVGN